VAVYFFLLCTLPLFQWCSLYLFVRLWF